MNSEQNNSTVTLKNRKNLEIKGIKKLESLNPNEFYIITNLGDLLVRGENLEMRELDMDKGNLWISGLIYSLEYIEEVSTKKNKQNILGKIFK
ncbi:MAG: sporulation protein YabP [Bacilli bacterium]|nr:sporulation protein YabP [Bacilli bacterium]